MSEQPRLSGESPCRFVNGLDGWTNCATHGWTGFREQRSRVLVCPSVNDRPARSLPVDTPSLDAERLARTLHALAGHRDNHPDFRGCIACTPKAEAIIVAYEEAEK